MRSQSWQRTATWVLALSLGLPVLAMPRSLDTAAKHEYVVMDPICAWHQEQTQFKFDLTAELYDAGVLVVSEEGDNPHMAGACADYDPFCDTVMIKEQKQGHDIWLHALWIVDPGDHPEGHGKITTHRCRSERDPSRCRTTAILELAKHVLRHHRKYHAGALSAEAEVP